MADATPIEWTDATWNPITGCTRVSEGCRNCYAEVMAARFSGPGQWGEGLARIVRHPNGKTIDHRWTGKLRFNDRALDLPLRWRKPRRIFVNSTSDLFHEDVPDEWIDKVFAVMALSPQHTFQVLTKRPERMREYIHPRPSARGPCVQDRIEAIYYANHQYPSAWPLPNVWIGTSIEDQATADARIPHLLDTPAAVRFVSAEPLLGPLDLRAHFPRPWKIDQRRRDWDSFDWPAWVPDRAREQIEDFWQIDYGRGPDAWLRAAVENGFPPLGTRGEYKTCLNGQPIVAGRVIYAWNNIACVLDDSGDLHVVSGGSYTPKPPQLDLVIVGGESGPGARPMHPDWVRSLRDQCQAAGVAFFFKQNGMWLHESASDAAQWDWEEASERGLLHIWPDATTSIRLRKHDAGRLLDGREWNQMPGGA